MGGRPSRIAAMSSAFPVPESIIAPAGKEISSTQVDQVISRWLTGTSVTGKRVLVIVPDATRTAPIGTVFKSLHHQIAEQASCVHVIVALGTHPPMSHDAICDRLEIAPAVAK